ncbi:hypothetical protein LINPERHAP1_LOCUS26298 [Linum perenne]
MEERTNGGQTQEQEDRISALPDGLIHDIIDRLPSPKTAAKLIFLSKRWNHLWLTYPIVKFDEIEFRWPMKPKDWFHGYDRAPIEPLKEFANAVLRKLSLREAATTAVRITVAWYRWDSKFCSSFLDDILDRLAAKKVPSSLQEIDFRFGHDCNIGEMNPVEYTAYDIPLGLLKFDRLRILKLAYCDFRLLTRWRKGELQVSSTPNLKVLYIENTRANGGQVMTDNEVRKLISKFSSAESITLDCVPPVHKLEIFNSEKLQQVRLNLTEVDALRLINFVHNVVDHRFRPRVTHSINEAANQSDIVPTDMYCKLGYRVNFKELK